MSTGMKWLMGIVVALAVVGIYWYSMGNTSTSSSADNSDAALNQDTSAIDAQMSAFASDNSQVDAGLNDQAVTQSNI